MFKVSFQTFLSSRVTLKFERRIARVPVVEEAERGGLLPAERLHGRAGRPHLEQEVAQNEWMKSNSSLTRSISRSRFHIYDCDDFTEQYFAEHLGISDLPLERTEKLPRPGWAIGTDFFVSVNILLQNSGLFSATEIAVPLPPHGEAAIGRAEDAAQNCLRLRPRAPRKDLNKFLQYSGKVSSLPLKMIHLWDTSYPFHMQLEIGLGFSLDWDFPACPTTEGKGFF